MICFNYIGFYLRPCYYPYFYSHAHGQAGAREIDYFSLLPVVNTIPEDEGLTSPLPLWYNFCHFLFMTARWLAWSSQLALASLWALFCSRLCNWPCVFDTRRFCSSYHFIFIISYNRRSSLECLFVTTSLLQGNTFLKYGERRCKLEFSIFFSSCLANNFVS